MRIPSFLLLCSALVLSTATTAKADTVIVRPQPGQRVIIKTAPSRNVVVRQAPAPVVRDTPRTERHRKVGLHVDIGGNLGRDVRMGGVAGALRIRPTPHVAIDLGAGIFSGHDYDGDRRVEVPLTANLLFYVNPQHRLQFYVLAGAGGSLARKEMPTGEIRDLAYAGGQAGLGLEFRIAPGFALNTDVRGFLRKRVDNDPRPEFTNGNRTTDLSSGALVTFGGTFYF